MRFTCSKIIWVSEERKQYLTTSVFDLSRFTFQGLSVRNTYSKHICFVLNKYVVDE